MGFITKCFDDETVVKTVRMPTTNKPWLTGEIRSLLKTCDPAFRSGDNAAYRVVRNNLNRGIKEAKKQYGKNLASHFTDNKHTGALAEISQSDRL